MVVRVEVRACWALCHAFHGGVVGVCSRGANSNALVGSAVEIRGYFNGTFVDTSFGVGLSYLAI